MNVNEWLEKVAYKKLLTVDDPMNCSFEDDRKEYEVWLSSFDGSYITQVGMEENVKFLADREITEELTHGVGFSPRDEKWYGWSHRAIYGFEIGSTCEKGDCHYRAANEDDEIKAAIEFWSDEGNKRVWCESVEPEKGLIHIKWEYDETIPNEKLRNTISGAAWHYDPENFGRGEWVAQTMADAKQMAVDFNGGVS